jgi:L-asparaginase
MSRDAEIDEPRLRTPIVHIITTGGTIASRVDPATGTAFPVMHAHELLAEIPELNKYAEPRLTEFALVPSFDMTPGIVARLARDIRSLLATGGVDGVVVTHGTDTMEESAFALDLLLDCEQPVVITGAMRNASQPGADGPRNLVSAVRAAGSRNTRGLGVAVVMNDQVHAPRYVTKSHTTATDTMTSPGVGAIGTVDDGGVWLRWLPRRLPRMPDVEPEPRVYLIRMAAGMDDLFLRTVLQAGARGVVIEGSGAGHMPGNWKSALVALLDSGMPVVLTSRCGQGRVVPIYRGDLGGITLRDMGVIAAGDLSGIKARIALMFALGAGWNRDKIRSYFARIASNDEVRFV